MAAQFLYGAPEGQDARVLISRAIDASRTRKMIAHVAMDEERATSLRDLIAFFAPDVAVVIFPAWDCLPYDRISPNDDVAARRVAALMTIKSWQEDNKFLPRIVLTTVNAATQRVMPRAALASAGFAARVGGRLSLAQLQGYLTANGYHRTDTVREQGEFAIRGDIVDLFPAGEEFPVRLDLFGDEVEKVRTFDPLTQLTLEKREEFSLVPVTEFTLDEESITRFRTKYRDTFGVVQSGDPLYEAVSEGRRHNGMDHWLPLFYEQMETLFDYLGAYDLSLDQHAAQSVHERLTQVDDFYQARKTLQDAAQKKSKKKGVEAPLSGAIYNPLPPTALYLSEREAQTFFTGAVTLMPFGAPEETPAQDGGARKSRDFADIRALPDGDVFGAVRQYLVGLQRKTIIAAYSEGSRERLKGMMEHAGIGQLLLTDKISDVKKDKINLVILSLESGFIANDLAVITEQDILGDRLARRSAKRKKADNFLKEVSALNAGDLVVHIDHGVGRFEGLETLNAGGTLHDCLKIIYAGGDKLFVPVENIEVLSRFGSDEGFSQLDKLGGAGWQARKAKIKKDLMIMAEGLLKIAAERLLRRAEKLGVDKDQYDSFAARFPYQETEDQQRAIDHVLGDMAGEQPMDRLVCGDVGFGKTEVALRAAYVAAMSGVQVALAVPTTLLARQHYKNFAARFAGTGLRVDQLSRLVSAKEAKMTKDGLRDGSVNIVIGTHALFGKEVKFSHLGLVIVDEEQRFGVKQKERLKELKSDVHVLTLTATPIPRTLQMSLTGVKEMSLITTPPVDRLAVRTFVLPYDGFVIREALLREHYRGGQSFYVCPRISDMRELEEQLKELVPEVKVIAAHGQMTPTELEDRMSAFYDGQYDVLLATNIIESGIDIPSANTMIVHRADMFGLSQLYQIRGRIGRSRLRAYAYLTYQPEQKLSATAQKRLEVLETLDTLGAGFQLASHDMDIRGAGNLLGEEQSGHIKEVGVELYQQMLEEAVAAARAGVDLEKGFELDDAWSPTINLGLSIMIPENYVEDLGVRMSLYRRLSDLEDRAGIEAFAAELIDRFGPIPAEVENLMDIVAIKQLCRMAGIDRVDAGPKGALIGFHKDSPPNVMGLMQWLTDQRGAIKLRPDQRLTILRQWDEVAQRVKGIERILTELAAIGEASQKSA